MKQFGWDDGAIVAGLLLLAWAIWLVAGLAALLGFVGTLLLIVGLAVMVRRTAAGGR